DGDRRVRTREVEDRPVLVVVRVPGVLPDLVRDAVRRRPSYPDEAGADRIVQPAQQPGDRVPQRVPNRARPAAAVGQLRGEDGAALAHTQRGDQVDPLRGAVDGAIIG